MNKTAAFYSHPMHRSALRQLGRGLAILAAALLAFPISAAAAPAAPATSRLDDEVVRQLSKTAESARIPVIVEGALDSADTDTVGANERRAQRIENKVRSSGGDVKSSSSLIGATVAELTPAQVRALASDTTVGRIHFDAPVHATSTSDTNVVGTPIVYPRTIGAPDAWKAGATGKGVTVAVLDSGIDKNPAFGARVKARVDLVDPAHPAQGDPAGHGTHVAGIIAAGRDSAAPGLAPDADLVSVRVLDDQGQSRLSTVIQGLEWTVRHRKSLNIDAIVMALGAPAQGSYRDDPLAAAVELAWRSGLVVVSAAGNDGPSAGTIQTPGYDPLVLTVGAVDDSGTPSPADDVIPTWVSQGPTSDGLAKPDLVAPGRKIVSLRVVGSTLDKLSPDHIEGPATFRLSGSSQATGVAGGAVALLLSQRPDLSPDQVKAILVGSARELPGVPGALQGAGDINLGKALQTRTPRDARQHAAPSLGLIRAILPQLVDLGRKGRLDGQVWDAVNSDKLLWDKIIWDKILWDKILWDKILWDKIIWDKILWDKILWDKILWDKILWDKILWDANVLWDQTIWD